MPLSFALFYGESFSFSQRHLQEKCTLLTKSVFFHAPAVPASLLGRLCSTMKRLFFLKAKYDDGEDPLLQDAMKAVALCIEESKK